jgi:chemotaxis protein methyltransferase CheR
VVQGNVRQHSMLSDALQGTDAEIAADTFEIIGRILKARSGFALEGYKDHCVKRRINIRVRATQSASAEAYTTLLTENPVEQEELLRVLTIHVSQFFRNPSTFECLARDVIPALLQSRGSRGVRITSIGCAGGEEPYSLALILRERFAADLSAGRLSLQGYDVDAATLDSATTALYHPDRLTGVPADMLTRWFTTEGQQYRLHPEIRSLVSFAKRDLNDAESWEPMDLILCRNVLIYFERERQELILNALADLLGTGGVLVLGKAETLFGSTRRRYRTVCPVERIYRVV